MLNNQFASRKISDPCVNDGLLLIHPQSIDRFEAFLGS